MCGKHPKLWSGIYAYINQVNNAHLPVGAGVGSPEQLLVPGLNLTVSVPTAMCINSWSE